MQFGSGWSVKGTRRPAPGNEAWQPKLTRGEPAAPGSPPVPPRLRRVSLQRERAWRRPREGMPFAAILIVVFFGFFTVLALIKVLREPGAFAQLWQG